MVFFFYVVKSERGPEKKPGVTGWRLKPVRRGDGSPGDQHFDE